VISALAPNRISLAHRIGYKIGYTALSLLGGHSPRVLYAAPRNMVKAVRDFTGRNPVDLAIFEYWHTYPYMDFTTSARRVLLAHDADFKVREMAHSGGGARSALSRGMWARNEARREREACAAVDEVWTLVPEDGTALSLASGVPASSFRLLPFGVDTKLLAAPPGSGDDTVLFFGSFAADFNRDALGFLLEEIWPRVRSHHPAASLIVAGGGLPRHLRDRAVLAGASCPGTVADLAALYASAAVVVIPLRFGGGLRIRLLEALACSRAVVATAAGIGDVEGRPGTHFEVADSPAILARTVVDLLKDREKRRRLGIEGRALVESRYSEEEAAAGIRSLAAAVVSGSATRIGKARCAD
jgi:glycosyltransferase involved in cell wall biosynthesis